MDTFFKSSYEQLPITLGRVHVEGVVLKLSQEVQQCPHGELTSIAADKQHDQIKEEKYQVKRRRMAKQRAEEISW